MARSAGTSSRLRSAHPTAHTEHVNVIECAMSKLVASLLWVFCAMGYAQQLPPGMKMHRVLAGSVDASGWTSAASTEGAFMIDLPCAFNDFTLDDLDEGSKVKRTFTVGCLRADRRKFAANRLQYRSGESEALAIFQKNASGEAWPNARVVKTTFEGMPAVDVEIVEATRCGFLRLVHVPPDNVLMATEAPKETCLGLAAMSRRFFASLRMTPAPQSPGSNKHAN